MRANPDTVHIR